MSTIPPEEHHHAGFHPSQSGAPLIPAATERGPARCDRRAAGRHVHHLGSRRRWTPDRPNRPLSSSTARGRTAPAGTASSADSRHDGYTVDVFPTPLRGLARDSAYLHDYLTTIAGPVVLVGHSYGGAVITDAAVDAPGVKALVYLDAFAPDTGENVLQLAGPQSALANPDPTAVLPLRSRCPTAHADNRPVRAARLLPGCFRR